MIGPSHEEYHTGDATMRLAFRCLAVAWLVQIASGAESNALDSLQARLDEIVSQPQFAAATWGIKIASLDSGKVLFEHNARKLLKPASNAKLYTAALALERLGPDFRIQTSLRSTAGPDRSGRFSPVLFTGTAMTWSS